MGTAEGTAMFALLGNQTQAAHDVMLAGNYTLYRLKLLKAELEKLKNLVKEKKRERAAKIYSAFVAVIALHEL